MQIDIISTGDEVITGLIVDTNAAWLSEQLLSMGLQAKRRSTVGDDIADLEEILSERSKVADIIFFNGGLGPTTDDNTTEAAAHVANAKLELHEDWLEVIRKWHESRNRVMADSNIKQAMLPEGATMIDNPEGTACGFMLRINKALCFFTPGVPHEFKAMFLNEIKPYLTEHVIKSHDTYVKRLFLFGIPEAMLQQKMNAVKLPHSIVLGYRAAYPELELKLICNRASDEEIYSALGEIRRIVSDYLITEDEFNLGQKIADLVPGKTFCIFDNVTAGKLGASLNKELPILTYLASDSALSKEDREFLKGRNSDFIFSVSRDDNAVAYSLYNSSDERVLFHEYQLDITIKNKKADAYALLGKALLLSYFSKRPPIRPMMDYLNRK